MVGRGGRSDLEGHERLVGSCGGLLGVQQMLVFDLDVTGEWT